MTFQETETEDQLRIAEYLSSINSERSAIKSEMKSMPREVLASADGQKLIDLWTEFDVAFDVVQRACLKDDGESESYQNIDVGDVREVYKDELARLEKAYQTVPEIWNEIIRLNPKSPGKRESTPNPDPINSSDYLAGLANEVEGEVTAALETKQKIHDLSQEIDHLEDQLQTTDLPEDKRAELITMIATARSQITFIESVPESEDIQNLLTILAGNIGTIQNKLGTTSPPAQANNTSGEQPPKEDSDQPNPQEATTTTTQGASPILDQTTESAADTASAELTAEIEIIKEKLTAVLETETISAESQTAMKNIQHRLELARGALEVPNLSESDISRIEANITRLRDQVEGVLNPAPESGKKSAEGWETEVDTLLDEANTLKRAFQEYVRKLNLTTTTGAPLPEPANEIVNELFLRLKQTAQKLQEMKAAGQQPSKEEMSSAVSELSVIRTRYDQLVPPVERKTAEAKFIEAVDRVIERLQNDYWAYDQALSSSSSFDNDTIKYWRKNRDEIRVVITRLKNLKAPTTEGFAGRSLGDKTELLNELKQKAEDIFLNQKLVEARTAIEAGFEDEKTPQNIDEILAEAIELEGAIKIFAQPYLSEYRKTRSPTSLPEKVNRVNSEVHLPLTKIMGELRSMKGWSRPPSFAHMELLHKGIALLRDRFRELTAVESSVSTTPIAATPVEPVTPTSAPEPSMAASSDATAEEKAAVGNIISQYLTRCGKLIEGAEKIISENGDRSELVEQISKHLDKISTLRFSLNNIFNELIADPVDAIRLAEINVEVERLHDELIKEAEIIADLNSHPVSVTSTPGPESVDEEPEELAEAKESLSSFIEDNLLQSEKTITLLEQFLNEPQNDASVTEYVSERLDSIILNRQDLKQIKADLLGLGPDFEEVSRLRNEAEEVVTEINAEIKKASEFTGSEELLPISTVPGPITTPPPQPEPLPEPPPVESSAPEPSPSPEPPPVEPILTPPPAEPSPSPEPLPGEPPAPEIREVLESAENALREANDFADRFRETHGGNVNKSRIDEMEILFPHIKQLREIISALESGRIFTSAQLLEYRQEIGDLKAQMKQGSLKIMKDEVGVEDILNENFGRDESTPTQPEISDPEIDQVIADLKIYQGQERVANRRDSGPSTPVIEVETPPEDASAIADLPETPPPIIETETEIETTARTSRLEAILSGSGPASRILRVFINPDPEQRRGLARRLLNRRASDQAPETPPAVPETPTPSAIEPREVTAAEQADRIAEHQALLQEAQKYLTETDLAALQRTIGHEVDRNAWLQALNQQMASVIDGKSEKPGGPSSKKIIGNALLGAGITSGAGALAGVVSGPLGIALYGAARTAGNLARTMHGQGKEASTLLDRYLVAQEKRESKVSGKKGDRKSSREILYQDWKRYSEGVERGIVGRLYNLKGTYQELDSQLHTAGIQFGENGQLQIAVATTPDQPAQWRDLQGDRELGERISQLQATNPQAMQSLLGNLVYLGKATRFQEEVGASQYRDLFMAVAAQGATSRGDVLEAAMNLAQSKTRRLEGKTGKGSTLLTMLAVMQAAKSSVLFATGAKVAQHAPEVFAQAKEFFGNLDLSHLSPYEAAVKFVENNVPADQIKEAIAGVAEYFHKPHLDFDLPELPANNLTFTKISEDGRTVITYGIEDTLIAHATTAAITAAIVYIGTKKSEKKPKPEVIATQGTNVEGATPVAQRPATTENTAERPIEKTPEKHQVALAYGSLKEIDEDIEDLKNSLDALDRSGNSERKQNQKKYLIKKLNEMVDLELIRIADLFKKERNTLSTNERQYLEQYRNRVYKMILDLGLTDYTDERREELARQINHTEYLRALEEKRRRSNQPKTNSGRGTRTA